MDAVCTEAKLDCVITPTAWDGIIPALTTKKIDVIWNSMSITDERKKTIDFSDKYYNTPTAVIGAKDQKFDATPEDLKGKVIGVQVSTDHAAYAKKHFTEAAEIKEYQTQDEANQDLAAGRIDATQADSIALDAFLKSDQGKACCDLKGMVGRGLEILGPGVGAGLRKEDTELKEKINAAIKARSRQRQIRRDHQEVLRFRYLWRRSTGELRTDALRPGRAAPTVALHGPLGAWPAKAHLNRPSPGIGERT